MSFADKRATTNTGNKSHIQEKKSCTDKPCKGSQQEGEVAKGDGSAIDDGGGRGDSSSGTLKKTLKFFKSKEKLQSFSYKSSPRQIKCTTTPGKIPAERNLETQNKDHSQESKKGSENEILRDKSQEVSEQEIIGKREAMQSSVNIEREQDSTIAKPCSLSACTTLERDIENLKTCITSKGSTSDSALIDVGNFIDSKDCGRVQTNLEVHRKRVGGHSKRVRGSNSKSSAGDVQQTQKFPEMMTLPMGRLRKREVKKKK